MTTTDDQPIAATLATVLAEGGDDAVRRIGEACLATLAVDRAAITVLTGDGRREPVWAGDDAARDLDGLQFRLGEGPCVDAFAGPDPVHVPDLADVPPHRWPVFAGTAIRTGVRGVHVVPLHVGATVVGILALYRDEPGMLRPEDLAGAQRVADAALWTLLTRPERGAR
ncbi:GAF domain-containing protein [Pseudonocardia hispaniensis]|uniref:GAF domain-containing protein n=1 Tax=Pseudonocardia hispaniensis TaxID=904933 RepID=A0ABW1IY29_9PSEU